MERKPGLSEIQRYKIRGGVVVVPSPATVRAVGQVSFDWDNVAVQFRRFPTGTDVRIGRLGTVRRASRTRQCHAMLGGRIGGESTAGSSAGNVSMACWALTVAGSPHGASPQNRRSSVIKRAVASNVPRSRHLTRGCY